jgi:hypothetical protein
LVELAGLHSPHSAIRYARRAIRRVAGHLSLWGFGGEIRAKLSELSGSSAPICTEQKWSRQPSVPFAGTTNCSRFAIPKRWQGWRGPNPSLARVGWNGVGSYQASLPELTAFRRCRASFLGAGRAPKHGPCEKSQRTLARGVRPRRSMRCARRCFPRILPSAATRAVYDAPCSAFVSLNAAIVHGLPCRCKP